jgi:phenylacetic acid degradation operon negative regulatory protein
MPTDFTAHIADLRELGGQRVWSLMISLFGDLAQAKGDTIDGPVLSAIMKLLDVKPEAVRVALHRLRNDGWIVSQKSGRISRHSLTEKGRRESAAASPRIYADPVDVSQTWQVVVLENENTPGPDAMTERGFIALAPRIFVGAKSASPPFDALCFEGRQVPTWLRKQVSQTGLDKSYDALHRTLSALQDRLPRACDLSRVETAVLRCLIVHNWRRLALKHPQVPGPLVQADDPGHRCHLLVANLLARYPRPDLAQVTLNQAA